MSGDLKISNGMAANAPASGAYGDAGRGPANKFIIKKTANLATSDAKGKPSSIPPQFKPQANKLQPAYLKPDSSNGKTAYEKENNFRSHHLAGSSDQPAHCARPSYDQAGACFNLSQLNTHTSQKVLKNNFLDVSNGDSFG